MSERYQVAVTESGRMNMPAAIRRDLGLHKGGQLVFVKHPDGGYEVTSLEQSIDRLQALFDQYVPKDQGSVEEFLQGRRKEAELEDAGLDGDAPA